MGSPTLVALTIGDNNGTAQMIMCVYCGRPCWRYASARTAQEMRLLSAEGGQAGLKRGSHNDLTKNYLITIETNGI